MQTGYLRAEVTTGFEALPIIALVTIRFTDCTSKNYVTDASGATVGIPVEAPDPEESLDPANEELPYETVDVEVSAESYRKVRVRGVQVFAGQTALVQVSMEPELIGPREAGSDGTVIYDIPPNRVDAGSGQDVPDAGIAPAILDSVVIPEYVTVHLGRPTVSASNVTVSFSHYIKNVCCSEIYPTWPENALRANIYCQISLVLNRIFTEWYRSRGYNFDITNSTSFDQYFVYGRNIFENVSRIVDEIFTTYARKANFIEPFYTEYCNGTTATCPGLKQWGTVTLAQQGYTPLGILRYYYGNQINLYEASIVSGVPSSYPGYSLSVGSTGTPVATIQTLLTRIRTNYPLIPSVGTVDGIYGNATRLAVRQFQSIFNLTVDGVVGKATWYKISYIYVAVKKLAELTSEGIIAPDVPAPTPTTTLRLGSTGETVTLAQYLLNAAADYYSALYPIGVDGVFGNATENAVRQFQTLRGITSDGVIGANTWTQLYEVFYAYMNATFPAPSYPGTALRLGSTGSNVSVMQRYLNVIGGYFPSISQITIDGIFGNATQTSVRRFQTLFGLMVDGIIGANTWNRIVQVYNSLVNA